MPPLTGLDLEQPEDSCFATPARKSEWTNDEELVYVRYFPLDARNAQIAQVMSTQSYRTTGLVLIFVSIAAALIVQFFGGGLVDVGDAHEMTPSPSGSGGG